MYRLRRRVYVRGSVSERARRVWEYAMFAFIVGDACVWVGE